MKSSYQRRFRLGAIIVILIVAGAIGFMGWKLYKHTVSQNENTKQAQSATNPNLITEYFAPANVSFMHDREWSLDKASLTEIRGAS